MVNVFSQFSLPQISTVARRTALVALVVGTVALLALVALGHPLAGLGVCVGMVLAIGNFRLISAATAKASATGREDNRRPLAMNTLGRLALISAVALGITFLSRPIGFGTLVGLALFQFILLANVVVAMLRDPGLTGPQEQEGGDE